MCRVPNCLPIMGCASRLLCGETLKLMLRFIPIEHLRGSAMVDNWRQKWEKAALMHRVGAAGLSTQILNELQCHGKCYLQFSLRWLVNITCLIG